MESSDVNLEEKAFVELNERPEERIEAINKIRQWILEEEDLNGATDDEFILKFLRCCKFNAHRTKDRIKRYYRARRKAPDLFTNRDCRLQEIQELMKLGVMVPMGYDSEGRRVIITRFGLCDLKKINFLNVIKLGYMVFDAVLKDFQTQICGVVIISDMTGLTAGHLTYFSVNNVKRIIDYLQSLPMRMKGSCAWNAPFIVDIVYRLVKIFLPEKLRQRIKVINQSDLDSLHQYLPPACLPEEYGGTAGNLADYIALLEMKMLDLTDYFLDDEKYGLLDDVLAQLPRKQDNSFYI